MARKVKRVRRFTQELIRQARLPPDERGIDRLTEWRADDGFVIRFTRSSGTYYLRHVDATVWLGNLHEVELSVAEMLHREARNAVIDGRDPVNYVQVFHSRLAAGDEPGAAHTQATHASLRAVGRDVVGDVPWVFDRLRQEFLAAKLPELRARYAKNFESLLRDPAFNLIAHRRVIDLTRLDLHAVREALTPKAKAGEPRGKPNSRTKRAINAAREMLTWGMDTEPTRTGLGAIETPWWTSFSVKFKTQERERTPAIEELARTIVLVERHRACKAEPVIVSPVVVALMYFVLITGQRTSAAAQLRREHIHDHPERKGWKIAHWPADSMKGTTKKARAHALPLPPSIVAMLESMWAETDVLYKKNEWAFRGHRGASHASAAALNQLFDRLRGVQRKTPPTIQDYEGKPGPKPRGAVAQRNLLERYGIGDFWFHDARRTIATFFDEMGRGEIGSAILGHRMKPRATTRESQERDVMADVTSRHYSTAQRIPLKSSGMEMWVEAFDSTLAAERAAWDERVMAVADSAGAGPGEG